MYLVSISLEPVEINTLLDGKHQLDFNHEGKKFNITTIIIS